MTAEDESGDWLECCRGCLGKATLVPIFDERDDISTKFFESTSITISENDGLPSYMCLDCLDALNYAHQFKKRCIKIDIELKQRLGELQRKYSDDAEDKYLAGDGTVKIKKERQEDFYVIIVDEQNGEKVVQSIKIEADDQDASYQQISLNEIKKEAEEHSEDNGDDEQYEDDILVPITESEDPEEQEQIIMDDTIPAVGNDTVIQEHEAVSMEDVDTMESSEMQDVPIDVNISEDSEVDNLNQRKLNLIQVLAGNADNSNLIHYTEDGVSLVGEVITGDLSVMDDGTTYTQEEVVVAEGDGEYQIIGNGVDMPLMYDEGEQETITVMQQEDGSFLCDCGEAYLHFSDYENHIKIHNVYECSVCTRGFESKEILQGHMMLHRSLDPMLRCPVCGQRIKRNMFTTHIKINHNQLRPICNICKKTFANDQNLKRHMLIHSGIKQYECEVCHECFAQKITLQNHRLTHTDQIGLELKCSLCSQLFENEQQLREHHAEGCDSSLDSKHPPGKPYTCDTCGKHYATPGSLKSHVEYIHSSQALELLCSECGEVLPSRKAMYAHVYTHRQTKIKNYKRFACSICGKGCASHAMLLMHERVHTNERPFQCPNCSLAFKTKTHLNTHQLTHTHEKRFGCSVCMKFFALKGNLVVHLRTHTGERPYICSICDQAFIDSKYLKKHKQKRHNISNIPWNQYY